MQSPTITTTVHRNEVEVSADWADEALALAQRVNRKIRQPTPIVPQPVTEQEYEPQAVDDTMRTKRPTKH